MRAFSSIQTRKWKLENDLCLCHTDIKERKSHLILCGQQGDIYRLKSAGADLKKKTAAPINPCAWNPENRIYRWTLLLYWQPLQILGNSPSNRSRGLYLVHPCDFNYFPYRLPNPTLTGWSPLFLHVKPLTDNNVWKEGTVLASVLWAGMGALPELPVALPWPWGCWCEWSPACKDPPCWAGCWIASEVARAGRCGWKSRTDPRRTGEEWRCSNTWMMFSLCSLLHHWWR